MNLTVAKPEPGTLSRIKLFFALSRTTHGVLDMATPAFAALLWLGRFPPFHITLLGLLTTFAGYTAVYALNDIVDYRFDKEKIRITGLGGNGTDLDTLWVRHPMAQGLLPLKDGITWTVAWSVTAIIGAALLNPMCVAIFLGGCLLEAAYCLLLRITHQRVILSGGVKTSGAMAAVFAVDPAPGAAYLICLFLLFFSWEIGGQNVPNDWSDIAEDKAMRAKTVPVRFGAETSTRIILCSLLLSIILTPVLFLLSKKFVGWPYAAAGFLVACTLLLFPALKLWRDKKPLFAQRLFNQASYFPLILLVILVIKLLFSVTG